ncbi:MAG: hypothetical protein WKF31_10640 [Thermoleophilaceae bacterium]
MHPAGKGADPHAGGLGVGGLRVVDVEDAVAAGHLLEAVRDARERGQRLADGLGIDPAGQGRRRRRHRVLEVVVASQADLLGGHQRGSRPLEAPVGRSVEVGVPVAEGHPPRRARRLERPRGDRDVAGLLAREHPHLRRAIGLERAVAVEVVGRHVEQHRALGREAIGVLELEGGGLADHHGVRLDPPDQRRERGAHVPRHPHRDARRAVDGAEQLDRGGLAVRAGHRQEVVGDQPPRDLELPDHGHAPLPGGADHRSARRDPRALDHRARPVEEVEAAGVQPQLHPVELARRRAALPVSVPITSP